MFSQDFAPGENYYGLLVNSLIKKNLYLVVTYYKRITFKTLERMFQIESRLIEEQLTEMVFNNQIYARIDRPSMIIKLGENKEQYNKVEVWIE